MDAVLKRRPFNFPLVLKLRNMMKADNKILPHGGSTSAAGEGVFLFFIEWVFRFAVFNYDWQMFPF